MQWGHKVSVGRNEQREVTRAEYNVVAGAETPDQPSVPFCAQHVWQWWWELNSRRPPGFESLAPLSFTEIKNWIYLTGRHVAPEEIQWLTVMDNAWLVAIAAELKAKRERDDAERERNKSQ